MTTLYRMGPRKLYIHQYTQWLLQNKMLQDNSHHTVWHLLKHTMSNRVSKYEEHLNTINMDCWKQSRLLHLHEVLAPMVVVLRQPTVLGGRATESLFGNMAISLVNDAATSCTRRKKICPTNMPETCKKFIVGVDCDREGSRRKKMWNNRLSINKIGDAVKLLRQQHMCSFRLKLGAIVCNRPS
jgi:hypothetical protein